MSKKRKYLLRGSIQTSRMTRIIAKGIDLGIVILLSLFYYPLGILVGCGYLAICDHLNEGQSVGKKLMGFKVLSMEDGTPCKLKQSFIRNLPFIIPAAFAIFPLWGWIFSAILSIVLVFLELYLLFRLDSGHRLGDVMADTTVIANDGNREDIKKRNQNWFENEKAKPAIS
jgi:uncharacterized RDD family membrane protein YckC